MHAKSSATNREITHRLAQQLNILAKSKGLSHSERSPIQLWSPLQPNWFAQVSSLMAASGRTNPMSVVKTSNNKVQSVCHWENYNLSGSNPESHVNSNNTMCAASGHIHRFHRHAKHPTPNTDASINWMPTECSPRWDFDSLLTPSRVVFTTMLASSPPPIDVDDWNGCLADVWLERMWCQQKQIVFHVLQTNGHGTSPTVYQQLVPVCCAAQLVTWQLAWLICISVSTWSNDANCLLSISHPCCLTWHSCKVQCHSNGLGRFPSQWVTARTILQCFYCKSVTPCCSAGHSCKVQCHTIQLGGFPSQWASARAIAMIDC